MERELITIAKDQRSVEIEESKTKSYNKENRTNRSFRVYDGEYAGIQFYQGEIDEDKGYKQAQDNLILKRDYKFKLETGSRHRDKTEREYSDKEFMEIAREAVSYLKTNYPDYIFSGSIKVTKTRTAMQNTLGLDLSNTDNILDIDIAYKHKDSKDITDGWFSIGQRDLDFKKFTDMADNYLKGYRETAKLPEELIIQEQYYGYLSKLTESLEAENLSLGTSLLSGKIGQKVFDSRFTLTHDVSDKETWNTPFFDGEGVTQECDRREYIKNGVIISGYADKRTAQKYSVPHTGSAGINMTDTPYNGFVNFRIERSDKTVKELLGGRLTVVPILAAGGGFNEKGEFVTPVQKAMLCDGEHFLGRLPEFAIKGNMLDIFGKNFIGVGSDDPVFNDKQILMRMEYSR